MLINGFKDPYVRPQGHEEIDKGIIPLGANERWWRRRKYDVGQSAGRDVKDNGERDKAWGKSVTHFKKSREKKRRKNRQK